MRTDSPRCQCRDGKGSSEQYAGTEHQATRASDSVGSRRRACAQQDKRCDEGYRDGPQPWQPPGAGAPLDQDSKDSERHERQAEANGKASQRHGVVHG